MSKKSAKSLLALALLGVIAASAVYLHGANISVLEPRGPVGRQERGLIITVILLSLVVVIPVFLMLFGFAWKYRAGNKAAKYQPEFDHSRMIESIWWGVPLALITILAIITWHSSRSLDPFKPLASAAPPMTIQAVAMDWKWLFIYPGQDGASVNYVRFPANTPIDFEITSDAPMNSFWIPQLGGQIYAMSGMVTHLHLLADKTGSYDGSSANISGQGFAGMHFKAEAVELPAFDQWVSQLHSLPTALSSAEYQKLAAPSTNNPAAYYNSAQGGLFDSIVAKYVTPPNFTAAGGLR